MRRNVERFRQQQISYLYYRGGSYFETNQYGANALRQAVNYGYDGGFRAGAADTETTVEAVVRVTVRVLVVGTQLLHVG